MTYAQRAHLQIAPLALGVAALAAACGWLRPEGRFIWLLPVAFMAVAWTVAARTLRPSSAKTVAQQRYIVLSVLLAGLQLALALSVPILETFGAPGGEALARAPGVVGGLALAVTGNILPKVMTPLAAKHYSPAVVQSTRRFAGWVFVMAGLACAAACLVAPLRQIPLISMLICGSAVLFVVLRSAWTFRGSRRS